MPLRHKVGLDKIMWGTDYPHKEASTPYTLEALRAAFAGVPHDETAKMLGGNAARVYGFDLDALAPIAQRIGPPVADVDVPLLPGDVPLEAEKCPALAGYGAALIRRHDVETNRGGNTWGPFATAPSRPTSCATASWRRRRSTRGRPR